MSLYEENGINYYIKKNSIKGFSLYENSRSLLVIYNSSKNEPLLVVLDERYDNDSLIESPDEYEKKLTVLALELARSLNVHLLIIKYLNSYTTFDNSSKIWLWTDEKSIEEAFLNNNYVTDKVLLETMERLVAGKTKIRRFNNNKNPAKSENDALSSAFHLWTRKNVGIGAFVDIDLVRFDGNNITELIELKRSFYGLEKWRPFNNDINNYSALSDIAQRLNIPLILIYNRQSDSMLSGIKKEYQYKTMKQKRDSCVYDIIDRIAVYKVDNHNIGYMNNIGLPYLLGNCSLDEFLSVSNTTDIFLSSRILFQKNESFIKRIRTLFGYLCSVHDVNALFVEMLRCSNDAYSRIQKIVSMKNVTGLFKEIEYAKNSLSSTLKMIESLYQQQLIDNNGCTSIYQDIKNLIDILERTVTLTY